MDKQTRIYPDHPHKGITIGSLLIRRDVYGGIDIYWNRCFKFYIGSASVTWQWRNKRYIVGWARNQHNRFFVGGQIDGRDWFQFPRAKKVNR